jgi:membrane-bound ClpP family serine protease
MNKDPQDQFAFTRTNYIILLAGLAIIVVGFLLMMGGGTDDPNVYNPDVFSPRRITVAPIVVMIGYVVVLVAIMKKTRD